MRASSLLRARVLRRPYSQVIRHFKSLAEHAEWVSRVKASAEPRPSNVVPACAQDSAPFLYSVDPMVSHLDVYAAPRDNMSAVTSSDLLQPRTPSASMLDVRYPLATDLALRYTVADKSDDRAFFRLSKFLEAVDALTADVAYRHTDGTARGLALVTAGHAHSRKLQVTQLNRDVWMRCYVTSCGKNSLEVRTDAIQLDPASGREVLINVCHTTMVALDAKTLRPRKVAADEPPPVPPLALETARSGLGVGSISGGSSSDSAITDSPASTPTVEEAQARQAERTALADWHKAIRSARTKNTMQIRLPVSAPPTEEEMTKLHEMHRRTILEQEQPAISRPPPPRTIGQYTFRSSFVVFPEKRNVHGKLFGGFVVAQAFDLAYYSALFFTQGGVVAPIGLDEATFLQPVAIGDLVTFTARVVHATPNTCRVFVAVESRNPSDPSRQPTRSNRVIFAFATQDPAIPTPADDDAVAETTAIGIDTTAVNTAAANTAVNPIDLSTGGKGNSSRPPPWVLPQTYSEILMHFEGSRRSATEGPTDDDARAFLAECKLNEATAGDIGK